MEPTSTPSTTYLICTLPRSGSTLLTQALRKTRIAGYPKEHFHDSRLRGVEAECGKVLSRYGPDAHPLSAFLCERCTPNGVFGTKFMYMYIAHIRRLVEVFGRFESWPDFALLQYLFFEPSYVYLWRRDKLRQAISLYRASRSRVWGARSDDSAAPERKPGAGVKFDYRAIRKWYDWVKRFDSNWMQFFESNRLQPIEIVFEDFVGDYPASVRKVLTDLDIPGASTVAIPPPALRKQSDEITDEWAARFTDIRNARSNSVIWKYIAKLPLLSRILG